jgi:ribosome-binding protein aMBF1 (putative translation factor)
VSDVQKDNGHTSAGINTEVEEAGEAHLRQMLATDPEFRRAWEEGRAKRELGMIILEKRMELGLSQRALAERVGTSQNRIYLMENGETNPTLDTLQRLSDVLGFALEIRPRELVAS